MKKRNSYITGGLGAALIVLGSCTTYGRRPLFIIIPKTEGWANTTWILTDPPNQDLNEFPGYRGFHLSQDGQLYLVNVDGAVGGRWSSDSYFLRLEFLEGESEVIPEGEFRGFENLFIDLLSKATHYVQVHNDLFLHAGTRQLIAFRVKSSM